MATKESLFCIRSKIWMAGNILGEAGLYRARISATEERLGKPLLIRDSQGSRLTPLGETLLKQFQRLLRIVETESDDVYNDLMAAYLDG